MNFTDAKSAQKAYAFFKEAKHPALGASLRVCQAVKKWLKSMATEADLQGLGPNLAYFITRTPKVSKGIQRLEVSFEGPP